MKSNTMTVHRVTPHGTVFSMEPGAKVESIILTREWRCWREDGSYYGPCTEAQLKRWSEHERGDWTTRHDFCGWQWYVMEKDL